MKDALKETRQVVSNKEGILLLHWGSRVCLQLEQPRLGKRTAFHCRREMGGIVNHSTCN